MAVKRNECNMEYIWEEKQEQHSIYVFIRGKKTLKIFTQFTNLIASIIFENVN